MEDLNLIPNDREAVIAYQEYVLEFIGKFGAMSNLIQNNEISPNELNLALGNYLKITEVFLAEYQRAKLNNFYAELNYEEWYAEKFEECKKEVISEYDSTNEGAKYKKDMVKPSLKEYDTRVKFRYKKEIREQKEKLMLAESEMRFSLRLLDILKKYDNILTTLSNNMRQEMRSLSAINRANLAVEENVSENKIRSQFPEGKNKTSRTRIGR